jgi:hypothetical protein
MYKYNVTGMSQKVTRSTQTEQESQVISHNNLYRTVQVHLLLGTSSFFTSPNNFSVDRKKSIALVLVPVRIFTPLRN